MSKAVNRRRLRTIAVAILLLPALLGRAMIPAGYMPMAGADGKVRLAFCPGDMRYAAASSVADPHAHHGMHTDGRGNAGHDHAPAGPTSSDSHQICPFALGASGAPLPTVFAVAPVASDFLYLRSQDAIEVFLPTVDRTQSPRAPPALS